MNNSDLNNLILPLIEEAQKIAKEKFVNFAQDLYAIPSDYWDHLWETPLVPFRDTDTIFPIKLSSLSNDKLKKIISKVVLCEMGESKATYIPFEKILGDLPEDAQLEYAKLQKDSPLPYDSVIVYNEEAFANAFLQTQEDAKRRHPDVTLEHIKQSFLVDTTLVFIHEYMHLNTDTLVVVPTSSNPTQAYHQYGVRFEDITQPLGAIFEEYDEVLVDIMAMLIDIHSNGNTLDNDLKTLLQDRKEVLEREHLTSLYEKFDDKPVFTLFTLFPDELAEWMLLDLGSKHKSNIPQPRFHNLLLEKYHDVFGRKPIPEISEMLDLAGDYFMSEAPSLLTQDEINERTEMLESIGVNNIDFSKDKSNFDIDFEDFLALIFSEKAMKELGGAIQDIRDTKRERSQNKSKEKYDIEP